MKSRIFLVTMVVFTILAFTAVPVFSQAVNSAQIHGFVTDSSGAVIVGAQIKATQTTTGLLRIASSGSDGGYSLVNLPVGPYQLEVSASGFRNFLQNGIVLQVGGNPQINVTLSVGSVSQMVEVTADTSMVETRKTAVSEVIDQRRIVDLPLNGRQATQLVVLSGGATDTTLASNDLISSKNYGNGTNSTSVTISVAGGQVNGTNYLLDGGDNNDSFSNVNLPFPFPDALQEFNVQAGTSSARYGLHPGGVVSIATKSGTNQFHGDLFEFLRNGAVNAKHFFTPAGQSDDTLKRNQFGGTMGGPIIKGKLMFFAGYQGTWNRQAPPTTSVIVPTAAVLSGDFSTIDSAGCQSNGKARTIKDPVTGKPFANGFVNPSRFNPQALALLKYVPVSADPCGHLNIGIPTTGDEDQVIGRVDWLQSDRHTFFGRYFIANYSDPAVFDGKDILTSTKASQFSRDQTLTLGDTYTLTSHLVNSLHVTGTRLRIDRGTAPNLINFKDLGVNIPNPVANAMVVSITGYFNVASGTATPGHFNRNALQVADDIDWSHGRHQVAFGVDWIHGQLNELSNFQTNGQFSFSGQTTGDGLLDFVLGLPVKFAQGNPEEENWRQNYWGLYVNDNYQVRSNLTLNAGVRWEPYFPAHDKFNRGSHFDPAAFAAGTTSQVFTNAPPGLFYCGDSQTPCSFVDSHVPQFSPRVGVVWDPRGKGQETIRAGYGIFYDNPETFYFDRFADNSPYGSGISLSSPAGGFTNPYQGQTVPPFPLPFPTSSSNAYFPSAGVYISVPLNLHPTYVQQWNLSFQKQVGANWLFSASYLGNKTTHLWIAYEGNPAVYIPGNCGSKPCSSTSNTNQRRVLYLANPAAGAYYSNLTEPNDGANASYNGMLLSVNHRFSQHFTLLVNYTWSHCISEGDFTGELTNSRPMETPNNLAAERGNCGFDRRQLFNSSFVLSSPRFSRRAMQMLLGNWRLSSIISYSSGPWLNILTGTDKSLSGIGKDRPDQIADSSTGSCPGPNGTSIPVGSVTCWFNTTAFAANAPGTFGNVGRNTIEGPSFFGFDTAVTRQFRIREQQRLQIRFEAFNVLNHPNFNGPNLTFTNSRFGQITTSRDPRILQFALKYVF